MAKRLSEEEKSRRSVEKQKRKEKLLEIAIERQLKEKEYNDENKKRLDFGISTMMFHPSWGDAKPMFEIRNKQYFEEIYNHSLVKIKEGSKNKYDIEINNFILVCRETVKKYIGYVFQQLSDAGGTLKLSKTCEFVQVMLKFGLGFENKRADIFYREKGAINLTHIYAKSVIDIFKKDSKCRAVVYSYLNTETRQVIFEKSKFKPVFIKKKKKKWRNRR